MIAKLTVDGSEVEATPGDRWTVAYRGVSVTAHYLDYALAQVFEASRPDLHLVAARLVNALGEAEAVDDRAA